MIATDRRPSQPRSRHMKSNSTTSRNIRASFSGRVMTHVRRLGFVCMGGWLWAGLLGLAAVSAQEIYLLPNATVSGGVVRLGEVAEIHGGTEADRVALQALPLQPFSSDRPALTAREIREALVADGWNLLYWQVIGANQVQLDAGAGETNGSRRALRAAVATRESRLAVTPAGTRFPPTPPAAQRTGIVQAQWRETLLDDGADEGQALPAGSLQPPVVGAAPAAASVVPAAGRTTRPTPTSQVWAFKRDMSRGQVIAAEDLEWITLPRSAPLGVVTDQEQIIGQVLRSALPAGRPILSQYLEAIKHVQRGKEVKLLSRLGGIEVSTTARAQADGTVGQTITIESLDRKRQYLGQVIGFNTVEVVSSETIATDQGTNANVEARAVESPATLPRRRLPNTLR